MDRTGAGAANAFGTAPPVETAVVESFDLAIAEIKNPPKIAAAPIMMRFRNPRVEIITLSWTRQSRRRT
jgi:hypothetical protein